MRVVFDTNIFISAFVIKGSRAEKAVERIIEEKDVLVMSKPLLDEILKVLARKFGFDREMLSRTAIFLSEISEMINPEVEINVFKEAGDNRVLECAVAGRADVIVTGDKEMLKLKSFEEIKIISLKEYLSGLWRQSAVQK